MRIEAHDSTGRPEPLFVVYAEDAKDFLILKSFLTAHEYSKNKIQFWLHSYGIDNNGNYKSFCFGWANRKKENMWQKLLCFLKGIK